MIKDPKTDLFIKFVYTVTSAIWLLIMPVFYFILYRMGYNYFIGSLLGSVAISILLIIYSISLIKQFRKIDKCEIKKNL